MRTPRALRWHAPIVVLPGQHPSPPNPSSGSLSQAEAWEIAKAIRPCFTEYANRYDTKKYWPDVYDRCRREFCKPLAVTAETLRDALLWKWGHLGKPAIPSAHELLITEVQHGWVTAVATLPVATEEAFVVLDVAFGGKSRFITVAFLLHLLYPSEVPIIDQHNFRAVNSLIVGARPGWRYRGRPSRYADIALVAMFMKAVIDAWRRGDRESVPSHRDLDKFLMMYGKSIKGAV
jgi:hypothetical protein